MRSISAEFNTVLALRARPQERDCTDGSRNVDEYVPELLEPGTRYRFDKRGQRIYPVESPLPLFKIGPRGKFSSQPLAIVTIESATHYDKRREEGLSRGLNQAPDIWTRGVYIVESVIRPGDPGMLEDACMGLVIG